MQKKIIILLVSLLLIMCLPPGGWASMNNLTVTGAVKQSLSFTTEDLRKFEAATVRINDIKKDGTYHGVFATRGVPLKSLLDAASIRKEGTGFSKPIDMAIVVRNKEGKKVTLSWGEVFYRNPGDVIIAYSATPVLPHHDCKGCHEQSFYKPYMDQLNRSISFPKLVMAGDFDSDRSLEGVVSIEVVNLYPNTKDDKRNIKLFSSRISINGEIKTPLTLSDLSSFPVTSVTMNAVGDGRGFHGRGEYGGGALAELLTTAGIKPDLASVFVVTAPDGYRSLFSYGELFLSPRGKRIIIADRENGKPLEKNGKFILVAPDDLSADREVKAVEKIEVFTFNQPAKLYIIGMGPGDTDLVTREALTYLGKTDAIVAPQELKNVFEPYLADKQFLFDSMNLIHRKFFANAHPEIRAAELDGKFIQARENAVKKMKEIMSQGRSIAFLDWGDPLIYGSSRWIRNYFSDAEIVTVPSLSAFNVSNAVLGRDVTCNGSLVMTVPSGLKKNEALLKAAADNGDTLVIFIGLKEFRNLMPLFLKYYKDTTPVAIVYNAGISSSEHRITGTLKDILSKTAREQEEFLGMIYIGPCLAEKGGECH
jgi:precorrin-4 methylase/DMSO/TMAO reductase YedYZ molybdopterin-dependent catalytic subunit